ncbi:MAG TPA: cytochrome c oxidase subunit 3 family protein [Paracoccus solventivorans]|uniref:Cytochrome c oxidase subunit 3 family protein n=1 Tax=Paracoccus solventivorans TaxID=53463 RepID=A0A832PLF3_9RHOB|nr:cytochrome c oxidase subunit 3 [Paracoccus solventivorans]HHW32815.1 cytochrome c oxidase subunit 3 family protein [Paracoccus solventivorans]
MTEATDIRRNPGGLPGELIMWVLIVSELAVFGAALLIFLVLRLGDPQGFAESQAQLHRLSAGINTMVLVSSGFAAALAARAAETGTAGARRAVRRLLAVAILLGGVFLLLKGVEYADAARRGLGLEAHVFFTFYWLLTLFHAAHVLAGMVILAIVSIRANADAVEASAQFWHMVDLVWVILFPVIYLL